MRGAWIAAVLSLAACAKTNTKLCGAVTCPAGTHCATVEGAESQCIPDTCGNTQPDGIEECDGDDSIDNETLRCTDYGFYMGTKLTCSESCTVDTSMCSDFCGDFTVNGAERCDGVPATGFACADFGFDVGTIGCTNACSPAFDFCSSIGWQTVPGGATDELYAVFLVTPNSGIAVGRAGTIVAAKDGIWLPLAHELTLTEDLHGVFGNTDGIFAVGDGGTILRYDGTSVVKMTSPTSSRLRAISGGVSGAIAVGDDGTIVRFDGTSWSQVGVGLTTEDLYGVHVVHQALAYAVGTNNTVLRFQNGAWTKPTLTGMPNVPVTVFDVFVVENTTGHVVFVSGQQTMLARIVGNTATVATKPFDVAGELEMRSVWATSPTDVYVAGNNGTVLHWNGTYLTEHDTPTNRTIYDIDGIGSRIVAVTRGGSVIAFNGTSRHVQVPGDGALYSVHTDGVHTAAAGVDLVTMNSTTGAWSVMSDIDLDGSGTTTSADVLNSVHAVGNEVYTGSQNFGLFKQDGASLVNVSPFGVNAIWATTSPLRIVTVGDKVIESINGAPFGETTTAHGANILRAVWAAPDGTWFAVGDAGVVLRRPPGGAWAALPAPTTRNLLGVWGSASDDVFAVGTIGTIAHWNGSAWRLMHTGVAENLVAISGNTGSDIFVTGTSFMRLHYDGLSWSRMASYNNDAPSVATSGGTTFYVSANRIERHDRVMSPIELRCGDPFDNDSDGLTNCDDPDCGNDPQCRRGGACETLERVTCETTALATTSYSGVARINDLPCLDHSTSGPEASYRYVAEASGMVTVTVDDPSGQLDLVVTDATMGHCELATCRPAVASPGTKTVTFDATENQIYYIIVDGPVGIGAPFTLEVSCGS